MENPKQFSPSSEIIHLLKKVSKFGILFYIFIVVMVNSYKGKPTKSTIETFKSQQKFKRRNRDEFFGLQMSNQKNQCFSAK